MNTKPENQNMGRSMATPLTIVSSIAVLISGVMMFFHIGDQYVKALHEWIGMAFVLFTVWHLLINWKPFKKHLKSKLLWVFFLFTIVASSAFVYNAGQPRQRFDMRKMMGKIESAPLSTVAPVFNLSKDRVIASLAEHDIKIDNLNSSVLDIAKSTGKKPPEIVNILFSGSNL